MLSCRDMRADRARSVRKHAWLGELLTFMRSRSCLIRRRLRGSALLSTLPDVTLSRMAGQTLSGPLPRSGSPARKAALTVD